MRKKADLDDTDQEALEDTVNTGSESIGMGGAYRNPRTPSEFDGYGICSSCSSLTAVGLWTGTEMAKCNDMCVRIRLNKQNPVTKCSRYERKGQLPLNVMIEMATLIDVKKKGNAGF